MLQTNFDVNTDMKMKPLGDSAVLIQLGTEINPEVHLKVKALTEYLETHPFNGFIECVPAFTSVTVFYNPLLIHQMYKKENKSFFHIEKNFSPFKVVCSIIGEIIIGIEVAKEREQRVVEIPVCYGGEFGPDLEFVAESNRLSTNEIIDIHSNGEYLVYMIGFAPGFPYLGGMSEKITTPRRNSPRLSIPAGTVGIAGNQTGVYPISTPGGWQLIGRTPIELFCPTKNPPSLLQSGDVVKFVPISLEEYELYKETNK
ncbi:5-oxoprolinase subunit PxpB [Bacillus sp. AFS041924]|uniref:5-oxoprolinase subunit PxpB n=1 Tax=Bacillus sp. AFS041924 TaxID=2033503 RepID=UPI0020D27143|nr:5-oxoprolinase subunit PxpB [Bacillus sp. AFS041924]